MLSGRNYKLNTIRWRQTKFCERFKTFGILPVWR